MGFEKNSTEVLLYIQECLLSGLEQVGTHLEAGTFQVSAKEGSAPPAESGGITLILLMAVEDELESRIRGFQRTVDPKLMKAPIV